MFSSVRMRLSLWYTLASGFVLIVFTVCVLSSLSHDLRTQFDRALVRTADTTVHYVIEFAERKNGANGAPDAIRELKLKQTDVAIFRGHELLASTGTDVVSMASSMNVLNVSKPGREPVLATDSKSNKRVAAVSAEEDSITYSVIVVESMLELTDELRRMRQIFLLALPVALMLVALGGFVLAGKSLEPVVALSAQAERITAKNLNQRLQVNTHDEFGRLAGAFNALLSRLDDSFRVLREFMADASHELRTPLAIIHGETEVSLARYRTADEYRECLGIVRDNSKRMVLIVRDLLALARADIAQQMLRKEDLYLDDLVSTCCRDVQALARLKDVQLTCEVEHDVSIHGDEELLKRMAINLLHNAVEYTPAGGSVSVKLSSENGYSRLSVSDTGIGIPQACVNRVFERFYRVNEGRPRAEGGTGLGLSIVRFAAESHGGSVTVASELDHGSTFTVCLPLATDNQDDSFDRHSSSSIPLSSVNQGQARPHDRSFVV